MEDFMDSGLSASDVLAMTKDNDGFGFNGGGLWVLIILLFLMGGNGMWGNSNGRAATVEDLNNTSNFSRLESQVRYNENAIQNGFMNTFNGICDSTFALNNTLGNMRYENAIGQKDLSSQISNCCCSTKEAIHAEGEATRALIQQNKIEALQQRINNLELQNATSNIVRYPTSMSYSYNANPFCNTGCGCNTNI